MMQIFDWLFSKQDIYDIYNRCKSSKYRVGESDRPGLPPTGSTIEFNFEDPMIKYISNKVKHIHSKYGYGIYRAYSNKFQPLENPYWHDDGQNGLTLIYYANTEMGEFNDNENKFNQLDIGGETQFYIKEKDEIIGVQPYTGRLIIFDASIFHRATPFRNFDRYNIAIKYE